MATTLPLICPDPTPVEEVQPLAPTPHCQRCILHAVTQEVCMPPVWDIGKTDKCVLIVGEFPTKQDALWKKSFSSGSSRYLRPLARAWYPGSVCYAYSLGCTPDRDLDGTTTPKLVSACRPYLGHLVQSQTWDRIICLGSMAFLAVLGRSPSPDSVRRGWAWLTQTDTPVYFLLHPARALQNRFYRKMFESDLKWALSTPSPLFPPPQHGQVHVVSTEHDAKEAFEALRVTEAFAFDCEWSGPPYDLHQLILSVALCAKNSPDAWVWDRQALQDKRCLSYLQTLMEDPKIGKFGHYIKADLHGMGKLGIEVKNIQGDTQIFIRLVESESRASLDVAGDRVGMGGHKRQMQRALVVAKAKVRLEAKRELLRRLKDEELQADIQRGKKRGWKISKKTPSVKQNRLGLEETDCLFERVQNTHLLKAVVDGKEDASVYAYGFTPKKTLLSYNGADAVATMRLGEVLEYRLKHDGNLYDVWNVMVKRATQSIYTVERNGFPVDRMVIEANAAYFRAELSRVKPRITPYGVNPDSGDDLRRFLYEELGLPVLSFTNKNVPSTDDDALKMLQKLHPVIQDIREYRKYLKYLNTYAEGILRYVRDDSRIHCNLKPDGTKSGRLSADAPSLHTIPSKEDDALSVKIREQFVASFHEEFRKKYYLVKADFSQLEFRVIAWLSRDPVMREIFLRGEDFHWGTAWLLSDVLWGKTKDQVTKDDRKDVKSINFGGAYGMSPYQMAIHMTTDKRKVTEEEAQFYMDQILGRFTRYAEFKEECIHEAMNTGFAWSYFPVNGQLVKFRRRFLPGIGDIDKKLVSKGKRVSYNMPPQGGASDMCLWSLIRLTDFIERNHVDAQILMSIHDALIFRVSGEELQDFCYHTKRIMEDWNAWDVPIVADIDVGENWAHMIGYEPWMATYLQTHSFQELVEKVDTEKAKKTEQPNVAAATT